MNFFRKIYQDKNTPIWIFTLFLSLFLWLTVKLQKKYQTDIAVPLKVVNLPENKTLKYRLSKNLHISIIGNGIDLLRLGLYDTEILLDCQDLPDSMVFTNINNSYMRLNIPPTVNLIPKDLIRPKKIVVVADQKAEKKVQTKVNVEVVPEPGFIVTQITTDPDTILLIGPQSILKKLSYIKTAFRSFKNVRLSFREKIPLEINELYNVTMSPPEVEVVVDIQRLGELVLENIPVRVKNISSRYQVIPLPSEASVLLKGGTEILSKIKSSDIEIYLNFNEYKPGQKLKAYLQSKFPIVSYEITPSEFEVIILRKRK